MNCRSPVDHILTLRTLIEQEAFSGQCLHSCFVIFLKALDIVLHDKLWEHF